MTLVLTPTVFLDLMRLCLAWEWEKASDRAKASHNREQPLYATQIGWTTVDKIVRILHGMEIVTKKQRSVLYKDRRLQYLVVRNTETVAPGDWHLSEILRETKKDFAVQHDLAASLNREKMLRDMRFYITTHGQAVAKVSAVKYTAFITKEKYFAEIERQEELFSPNQGAIESVMTKYRQKVATETREK